MKLGKWLGRIRRTPLPEESGAERPDPPAVPRDIPDTLPDETCIERYARGRSTPRTAGRPKRKGEGYKVAYWSQKVAATPEQIEEGLKVAEDFSKAVRRYLDKE